MALLACTVARTWLHALLVKAAAVTQLCKGYGHVPDGSAMMKSARQCLLGLPCQVINHMAAQTLVLNQDRCTKNVRGLHGAGRATCRR